MSFSLSRPGFFGDQFTGPFQAFLAGLMLLTGLILLAAGANLGSLLAARAADCAKEVALRLALGSTGKRILRGLFTEDVLVSLAGGAVGLWDSVFFLRRFSDWQPFGNFPVHAPVNPDGRVYGFGADGPSDCWLWVGRAFRLLALGSAARLAIMTLRGVPRTCRGDPSNRCGPAALSADALPSCCRGAGEAF